VEEKLSSPKYQAGSNYIYDCVGDPAGLGNTITVWNTGDKILDILIKKTLGDISES